MFELVSKYKPKGDQPKAIKALSSDIKHQTLLGVTGSGKTFSIANVINNLQKPTLVISHNKTLAAQLYQEFKEFFPNNAVHYFVSYYDYYQPEAYIPHTDTYIEKDAKINQEIDRLRHSAVQDLSQRKDVIIIASVSCIYGLGSPENYQKTCFKIEKNQTIKRKELLSHLVSLFYQRNDVEFKPGNFRVRGDIVEINLITGEKILKIEFFNDKIEKILEDQEEITSFNLFPAKFWTQTENNLKIAVQNIKSELEQRLKQLQSPAKERLETKTNYDLEMIEQTGTCSGIENYSRHLEFRKKGEPPFCLLDHFPKDFLCIIDESHMAIPQLRTMHKTDKARKRSLIEHGFRLPSALDNRPLCFKEFEQKTNQVIYSSATPSDYEKEKGSITEQLIRPTGLLEPTIEIRPLKNQVKDLIEQAKKRIKNDQRVLAITLTKRMSEELANYLEENDIKAKYLHSEIKTMERPKILQEFRQGKFDVLVGINLLREGLDLPEVSLIGIFDADKEGFLRNETTLIQTMGRAARHKQGHVILYADQLTKSIKKAIKEVVRRRKIQEDYNRKHNITPTAIKKAIRQWGEEKVEFSVINDRKLLLGEMEKAAQNLDFERAAEIRDILRRDRHAVSSNNKKSRP